MMALMALAASHAVYGTPFTMRAAAWFIAFSMCVLALLKLQDVESFSSMFMGYDLLGQRWVRYAYAYPFLEGIAGVLMVAGALNWISTRATSRTRRGAPPVVFRTMLSMSATLRR